MKIFKKVSVLALSAALLLSGAACGESGSASSDSGSSGGNYTDPNTLFSTYDNKDYNEYLMGDKTTISNQWEGYGIGDPFVMRYNGVYYLYCSTLDSELGVRAYKSADLVNWTRRLCFPRSRYEGGLCPRGILLERNVLYVYLSRGQRTLYSHLG